MAFNFYRSENDKKVLTAIMADSYLANERLNSEKIYNTHRMGKNFLIHPHEIQVQPSNGDNIIKYPVSWIDNYSVGGGKFSDMLNTIRTEPWANNMPRVTVVHLGACDLANTSLGRGNVSATFGKTVFKFLTDLKDAGRRAAVNKEKYDAALSSHIFIIVGVPDWGDFKQSRQNSLNSTDFRKARSRANSSLKKQVPSLYKFHRAIVFTPELVFPERSGIHLAEKAQPGYLDQILDLVARITCSHCSLSREYIKAEHFLALKQNKVCRNPQHQQPPQ